MVHQPAAAAIPPVGSSREPGAGRLALTGVVLLLSGVAAAVSEIPQWGACLDELYGPACVAGQEHHLYSSVLPGPAWIGEPWAVLLHGAALLGIAAAVALLTAGRLDRVWRALLVYPTACVGLLTLIPGVIGRGLAVNVAVEWGWITAVPPGVPAGLPVVRSRGFAPRVPMDSGAVGPVGPDLYAAAGVHRHWHHRPP